MPRQTDTNVHLEPRVAKLEVGLDRLTEDVRSLAGIVREQGGNIEKQLNDLTIGLTQAAGPRKTDWSMIISAVLLVMAIGSAVFWPLDQMAKDNKLDGQKLQAQFSEHIALDAHPVGKELFRRLEEIQKQAELDNITERAKLDKNIHVELELKAQLVNQSIEHVKEVAELRSEKMYTRILKLEEIHLESEAKDREELRMWRFRAMTDGSQLLIPPALTRSSSSSTTSSSTSNPK